MNEVAQVMCDEKFKERLVTPNGMDDYGELVHHYMKIVELNKDNVHALIQLGYLYSLSENFDKSISWFHKALKIDSNNVELLLAFATECEVINDLKKMAEISQKAVKIEPKNREARALLLRAKYGLTGNEIALNNGWYIGSLRSPRQSFLKRCNPFNKEFGIRKCAEEIKKHTGGKIKLRLSWLLNYNNWLALPITLLLVILTLVKGSQNSEIGINFSLVLFLWIFVTNIFKGMRNRRAIKLMSAFGKHLIKETGEYLANPDLLAPGEEYYEECGAGKRSNVFRAFKSWYGFHLGAYLEHLQDVLNRHWWYHLRMLEQPEG